jgi:hypothetical protein
MIVKHITVHVIRNLLKHDLHELGHDLLCHAYSVIYILKWNVKL